MATSLAFRAVAVCSQRAISLTQFTSSYQTSVPNSGTVILERKFSTAPRDKFVKDGKIPYRVVQLADEETGKLGEPRELSDIIASIDKKLYAVVLVKDPPNPIVKIINKKESYDKMKEAKAKAKAAGKAPEMKEVQLTWGVDEGDFQHKLKKIRQELEKGNRINVVYAPKKGQRRLPPFAMREILQKTVTAVEDVGQEWKPSRTEGATAVIFLQGKRKKHEHS